MSEQKPVAYLVTWNDGEPRSRVQMTDKVETWLALKSPSVQPLYRGRRAAPMSEIKPVAYRWKHKDSTLWGGADLNAPTDTQYRCFDVEPLYHASAITSLQEENAALAAHACVYLDGSGLTGDEQGNSICLMQRRVAEMERLVLGYRDNNDELAAAWSVAEARAFIEGSKHDYRE